MRFLIALALFAFASPASASPPPPPPEFVGKAAAILIEDVKAGGFERFADLFADDVAAFHNGRPIATGKAAWLAYVRSRIGRFERRLAAYSLASMPSEGSSGDLLVIDEVQPVAPPGMIADARWGTRATLYQFGQDQRIHAVRIVEADGFLRVPHTP
jgi:hypothetical protein